MAGRRRFPAPKAALTGAKIGLSRVTFNPIVIVSQLFLNKQKEFLTDKTIVFHGQSYHCHSSFLSSFSPVLKEKLLGSDPEVHFPQLESIVPNADLFFQILDYCYGQPFHLTLKNIGVVLTLCSSLQLSSLSDPIHKVISKGFSTSRDLRLKSEEVLQTIKSSVQRDVMLSYKGKSLTISSLVLICSSEYFKNMFCSNFADSNERKFSYSDEFTGVSVSNFETFFKSFLGESFDLDVNNVIDFYQLSTYFSVDKLKETCNSFVPSITTTRNIFLLLKTTSERNLLNFLRQNTKLFGGSNKVQDLPPPFPLPLSFISLLIEVMSNSWLLHCLTLSITDQQIEEDYRTLSQIFEKIVVNDGNISEIYTCLIPLFDQSYLHQFILTWSRKVFLGVQNVHVIPDEWFLWCLSQSCLNHKRWKVLNIDFLIQNFSLIIEAGDLFNISFYSYLTPEIFKNLKNLLPRSYDLFLINCFVKTWKETELWTVKDFEDEILKVDFQSSVHNIQILNILSKLTTDHQLAPFLTVNLLNHSLSTLNSHDQELTEVKQQVIVLSNELGSLRESVRSSNECHSSEVATLRQDIRGLTELVSNLCRLPVKTDSVLTELIQLVNSDDFVSLAEKLITVCDESPLFITMFFDSKAFNYLRACKIIIRRPDVATTLLLKLTVILTPYPRLQGLMMFYKHLLRRCLTELDEEEADAIANNVSELLAQFFSQPDFKEIKQELDDHNE
ncbi:hypothetical protein GEMRC1_009309 [Eukaryota sp. GEM-RC1]